MSLFLKSFFVITIGISVIIGYYFSILLLIQSKGNRKANFFLSGFTFATSYFLTVKLIIINGLYAEFPQLLGTAIPVWYLTGPLFYYYIKSYLIPDIKFKLSNLLHLAPFLLIVIYRGDFLILSGSEKLLYLQNPSVNSTFAIPLSFAPFLILIGYFILSLRLISRFQTSYKTFFSNTKIDQLGWVRRLLILFIIYLSFDVIAGLSLLVFRTSIFPLQFLTFFALSLFVHLIAYHSIKYPESIFFSNNYDVKKYQSSNLTEEKLDAYLEQLNTVMLRDKIYLDNNLSLNDLADKLKLKAYHVSQIINHKCKLNFYDYVNKFRVSEAKKRLSNPEFNHLSILGIALDVGFNSKTSFNSNFKKFENITPSAYRKKTDQSSHFLDNFERNERKKS